MILFRQKFGTNLLVGRLVGSDSHFMCPNQGPFFFYGVLQLVVSLVVRHGTGRATFLRLKDNFRVFERLFIKRYGAGNGRNLAVGAPCKTEKCE